MAIQVSGTEVISNSRVLTNVSGLKTVGGLAILGSGDIPLPTGVPAFNPTVSPNYSINSSATWTKPSLSSATWCVIQMVGGGGASNRGNWGGGGNGGSAVVVGAIASTLPASIAFTVGAGGAPSASPSELPGSPGGDTSATINGRLYKAIGGYQNFGTSSNYSFPTNTVQPIGSYFMVNSGVSPYEFDSTETAGGTNTKSVPDPMTNSQFGGGAGGGTTGYTAGGQTGTSQYAGNGGAPNNNGSAFGGGGGGGAASSTAGAGGAGGVKIWYIS